MAKPGELLAIMGPSGSGKSSLLTVLSGSIPAKSNLTGSVTANGNPLGKNFTKKVAGFVHQDDLLFKQQTVYETLRFSALLRLPNDMTLKEKEERVEDVISQMGLRKCRDTPIGGELVRGVSGGERKRVSVAAELVRDVSVLLMDEPTSGLDSFMAFNVIQSVKRLAKELNVTVIATIHQPRSQIWNLFDKVMLLSEGKLMYFGAADQAVPHFERLGFPMPANYNPADHLLDIISVDYRSKEIELETKKRVDKFEAAYRDNMRDHFDGTKPELLAAPSAAGGEGGTAAKGEDIDKILDIQPGASFFLQFKLLFMRSFKEVSRDKFATVIRLFQTLFFAILVGLIYLNLGNGQASIVSRVGLLFFLCINQAFGAMFGVISRFPAEKEIYNRENSLGFYHTLPYFLGRIIAELPFSAFFPFLSLTVVYWMAGLQADGGKYITAAILIILVALSSEGIGLISSTIAPNVVVANILAPLITIIFLLLGGFYIQTDNIPKYFKWIETLSYLKYGYRGLMVNEFSGLTLDGCSTSSTTGRACYGSGEDVLKFYSMSGYAVWADVLYTLIIVLALRVLSYGFLVLNRPKRKLV
eukprot:TRINITY_DN12009_c0_g1_i1.p1 TRINITY_DN12009_c0_g1~~TRINITY_DN12009_c0_g1_i1.p1  ORF type:complete len:643 (+),score=189.13 TRINITY_DN12009_c0_g1_i1:173-1930(+)